MQLAYQGSPLLSSEARSPSNASTGGDEQSALDDPVDGSDRPAGQGRPRISKVWRHGWADGRADLDFGRLDALALYATSAEEAIVWLTQGKARALAGDLRRAQPTPHRWPTDDVGRDIERVVRYVEAGRRPSRHAEVGEHWSSIEALLPGARTLAGTFTAGSGPNCFGAVMGAAGVEGAADQWMQLEPFEEWLTAATTPGGEGQ